MARRGHSTTIGKFAKHELDRRRSEIRMFGDLLRREQQARSPVATAEPDRADAHHND
ncbi:hypothetical protein Val02_90920 [Virgisporangium aliadipatigenens]|uniref:Uncharacterized protein n=1 Tax=Virgisporangium aliadipatigenens TaxID=741659 RepID=A0A8J3YYT2_9ACTN|nr:hypothetical protein [Virgisporangium aliadipatigenens]GIJ52206.1 hypothetical protein Val02_90920 [Virgisporangium aliadipatigenens]